VSWQQGDRWAGGELLREYERFIHSQTPRMPSNAAYGSDDAAQNTRIVFLDRLMTWKPDQDASPLTYLCECHLKSASYRESATARYPVALPVHLVAFLCAELRGWRSVATLGEVMALLPTWSGTRGGDGENLVSSETIEAAMSAIARPMYLDGPPDDRAPPPDDDMDPAGHFLVDPQPTPEDRMVELDATATMRAFLAAPDIELSPRERVILYERITAEEPLTLKEIGARFNCTRERIRQVEKALLKRLRQRFGAPLDVSEDDEISE
jgi:RNA polymerase sigma factor (sigma-70 family)